MMTALITSNPDAKVESDQIQAAVEFLAAKGVPVVLNVVIDFGAEDEIIKPGFGKDRVYFRNNIVKNLSGDFQVK